MLMSTKKEKKRGGRASVENSFDSDSDMKKMLEKQVLAQKIKENSNLQKEIQRNRKTINNELDGELVKTYETYQAKYSCNLGKYDKTINILLQTMKRFKN